MPRTPLEPRFAVEYLSVLDAEGNLDSALDPSLPAADLKRLYRAMLLARRLDERMVRLQRQGRIGTFAPIKGQEASQLGSVVALLIFTLITAAHFRVRAETGASTPVLAAAIVAAGVVLLTFVFTTLVHEPASMITLLAILVLSVALDVGWKRIHVNRTRPDHLGL